MYSTRPWPRLVWRVFMSGAPSRSGCSTVRWVRLE